MSRKDYELIANVIKNWNGDANGCATRESLARAFASELLNTNPKFDTVRFIAACREEKTDA